MILVGFELTEKDISLPWKKVQTNHKMIEAFKFAYARRALLGDPEFLNETYIDRVCTFSICFGALVFSGW